MVDGPCEWIMGMNYSEIRDFCMQTTLDSFPWRITVTPATLTTFTTVFLSLFGQSALISDKRTELIHFFSPLSVSAVCGCDLVHSGFFHHSGEYICTEDYQRLYGTQCDSCDQYITGEVVSALGRTYHPHCFVCSICRQGKEFVCIVFTYRPIQYNTIYFRCLGGIGSNSNK